MVVDERHKERAGKTQLVSKVSVVTTAQADSGDGKRDGSLSRLEARWFEEESLGSSTRRQHKTVGDIFRCHILVHKTSCQNQCQWFKIKRSFMLDLEDNGREAFRPRRSPVSSYHHTEFRKRGVRILRNEEDLFFGFFCPRAQWNGAA
jgi:hypothetical protein